MGLLDFLRGRDIDHGVGEYGSTPGAILLDVRTEGEYRQGHIPGSQNIPLHAIDNAIRLVDNIHVPLFVYCHSGARSRRAAMALRQMGYRNVKDIGGIAAYTGRMEQ